MNIHRISVREALEREIPRHIVVEAQLTELELDILADALQDRARIYDKKPCEKPLNPVRLSGAISMFEQMDALEPLTVVRARKLAREWAERHPGAALSDEDIG